MSVKFSKQILMLCKKQQRLYLLITLKVSIFLNYYFKLYTDNLLKHFTVCYTHKADYHTAEKYAVN